MSYQREDIDKNNVKFTVAVDKAVINSNHEQALKMLGKDAKVAGFRKGHVPLEVLERSVDPARLGEMEINGSINQMVMQIIRWT